MLLVTIVTIQPMAELTYIFIENILKYKSKCNVIISLDVQNRRNILKYTTYYNYLTTYYCFLQDFYEIIKY